MNVHAFHNGVENVGMLVASIQKGNGQVAAEVSTVDAGANTRRLIKMRTTLVGSPDSVGGSMKDLGDTQAEDGAESQFARNGKIWPPDCAWPCATPMFALQRTNRPCPHAIFLTASSELPRLAAEDKWLPHMFPWGMPNDGGTPPRKRSYALRT